MNQTYTFVFTNWSLELHDVTNVKTNLETMYNNNLAKHEGKFQRNGLHHNHILIFHLVWNLEIFSSERQKETRKKLISWPIFLCWIPNVHQESINCHGLVFLMIYMVCWNIKNMELILDYMRHQCLVLFYIL